MDLEKKKRFLINAAYYSLLAVMALLFLRYVLPISLPFLFGFLVAYLVIWITDWIRWPERGPRIALAVALYLMLWGFVAFFIYKSVDLIGQLAEFLPDLYNGYILPKAELVFGWIRTTANSLDPGLFSMISKVADSLMSNLGKLLSWVSKGLVNFLSGAATGVPSTLLSIVAMMFSTIFVILDWDRIRDFFQKNLPVKLRIAAEQVREYITDTLFVVLRSYLLIMLITFVELSILFLIFGIEHPLAKASLIAVLDILPLLGTGAIMIPWAIVYLVMGKFAMGIKLLVIYVIVTLIRNYIEPKIVGAQLGLRPIITLVSMFIGLRLFGFFGMFGLPLAISFFWKMRKKKLAEKAAAEAAEAKPAAPEAPPEPPAE